jgi:hypothetical protein
VVSYVIYLAISGALTFWAARTLSQAGREFLVTVYGDAERLPEAVTHLLMVGYYLVDFGFVCLYLRTGASVNDARELFEGLSRKLGVVMLMLGMMHLGNVFVLHWIRRSHHRSVAVSSSPESMALVRPPTPSVGP